MWQMRLKNVSPQPPRYISLLGAVMSGAAFIAFASAGSVLDWSQGHIFPFDTSYVKYLCAANVLGLIFVIAATCAEMKCFHMPRFSFVLRICEPTIAILLFVAAVICSLHYDADMDFCEGNSRGACATYRTSVFFTWVFCYCMAAKLMLTRAAKNSRFRHTTSLRETA